MYKLLVVDDDAEILKLLKNALEMKGYVVVTRQEISLPLEIDDYQGFDLILLDIMMPKMEGTELCQRVRSEVACPIVFISAKDQEEDLITALNLGGDDYITKPFSINHLLAKVSSHLKREERRQQSVTKSERLFGRLKLDTDSKVVYVDEKALALTKREYDIVELLSAYPRQVFSREMIYERVYDQEADALFRSISEYVYQLRSKFARHQLNPIVTVRGRGYKWNEDL